MRVQTCWGAAPGALPAREAAVAVLEGMGVLDDSAGDDPYAAYLLNTPLTPADVWTAVFGHVDKVERLTRGPLGGDCNQRPLTLEVLRSALFPHSNSGQEWRPMLPITTT